MGYVCGEEKTGVVWQVEKGRRFRYEEVVEASLVVNEVIFVRELIECRIVIL